MKKEAKTPQLSTNVSLNWKQHFLSKKYFYLILLVGILIRIWSLGSVPGGLNQDEASIGYDAYALANFGVDRHEMAFPVHLEAWGSGQNALYAYLSIPFIWMFGLTEFSIRIVNALFGILGLIVFYLFAKRAVNEQAGLIVMFFLAINPWHIMMSRWALESNLFPSIFLIGSYYLLRAIDVPRNLYLAGTLISLSLYAYGTSYFFVPLFLVFLFGLVIKYRTYAWKHIAGASALLIAIALPILLFVRLNRDPLSETYSFLFLTIPKLAAERLSSISTLFRDDFWSTLSDNFGNFIKMFLSQNDGLLWNALPEHSFIYLIGLPGMFYAIAKIVKSQWHSKTLEPNMIFVVWFVASILLACVVEANINRINIVYLPIIYLMGIGLYELSVQFRKLFQVALIICLAFLLFFTNQYFDDYAKKIKPVFNDSIAEAIQFAAQSAKATDTIYYMDSIWNQPYIFVLFYEKIDPHTFAKTVVYDDPNAMFANVYSFDRYRFFVNNTDQMEQAIYVFANGDQRFTQDRFDVTSFENYSVAIPRAGVQTMQFGPNLIFNGDFEQGDTDWNLESGTSISNQRPTSGQNHLYLDPNHRVTQRLQIPADGYYLLQGQVSAAEEGKIGAIVNGKDDFHQPIYPSENYQVLSVPPIALKAGDQVDVYLTSGKSWVIADEMQLIQLIK